MIGKAKSSVCFGTEGKLNPQKILHFPERLISNVTLDTYLLQMKHYSCLNSKTHFSSGAEPMNNNSIFLRPLLAFAAALFALVLSTASLSAAETKYKPFILAQDNASGDMADIVNTVKTKLTGQGFEIAGQYSPYADTTILVVTSDQLRQHASQSEFGVFGAIQRVSITKTGSGTQVSYTNPIYMAYVYRMKSDLSDVKAQLVAALGQQQEYGSEQGLTADDLQDYHYKMFMPYFYDRLELGDYDSQQAAIEKVESLLATKKGGTAKVYRVDLPGKEETIIGVSLAGPKNNDCSGDHYIMSRIDFKPVKSSAHLPYEIIISKGNVYALYAEFRIAINFPDLSMIGSNSFASIMCAPSAIEEALRGIATSK